MAFMVKGRGVHSCNPPSPRTRFRIALFRIADGLLIQLEQLRTPNVINDLLPVLVRAVQSLFGTDLTGHRLGEVDIPYFHHLRRTGDTDVVLEDRVSIEVVRERPDERLGVVSLVSPATYSSIVALPAGGNQSYVVPGSTPVQPMYTFQWLIGG